MNDNIVQICKKPKDSELLGEGMSYLAEACARFMEIQHKEGYTLFRMTDSILFYVEHYLLDHKSGNDLPKPTHEYIKELEGLKDDDDTA